VSDQYVVLGLYASVIAFVVIFLLAFTNKIIVFYDHMDLAWSLMIVLGPLLSLGGLLALDSDVKTLSDEFFFGETVKILLTVSGGAIGLLGVLKTYQMSILCNGLLMGLIIGSFRVVAAVLILLAVFGFVSKLLDKKGRSVGTIMVTMLFFGVFVWIVSVLINGDRAGGSTIGPHISLVEIFLVLLGVLGIFGGGYWYVYLAPDYLDAGRIMRLAALAIFWVFLWQFWRKILRNHFNA